MAGEIIGRREALLVLGEFLEAVPAGGRRALLFEGDEGIGKTALWEEGMRLARRSVPQDQSRATWTPGASWSTRAGEASSQSPTT